MNLPLIIFDIIIVPITIIRLFIIYFFGSKYNIKNFGFLDVMMHATHKYFNQQQSHHVEIDTIDDDIRVSINTNSKYIKNDISTMYEKEKETINIPVVCEKETVKSDLVIETNNDTVDKNKLLTFIEHLTSENNDDNIIKPKSINNPSFYVKMGEDINKLNNKLKTIDKVIDLNSD